MSQLIDNLNTIESVKTDIRSAIEAKGVSMSGISFPDYPSAIASISTAFATETLSVSVNGTYTPGQGVDGYSQVVVDVPQSVTGYTEKDITEAQVNVVNLNNSASFVASGVFRNNLTLQTVSLSYCSKVGDNAFQDCKNLESIDLPVCKSIGSTAFQSCSKLIQVSLPVCKSIGSYAFWQCNSIPSIDLPVCEYIGNSAFFRCSFSQISLPNTISIQTGAFNQCGNLESVYLPLCTYIGNWAFNDSPSLSVIDLPVLGAVTGSNFIERCSSLTTIYLDSETYEIASYFLSTTNIGVVNSIYTHFDNISRFAVANGWSSVSSLFVGIGDSDKHMLTYSDSVVTGYTKVILSNFSNYLSIRKIDVTSVNLSLCEYVSNYTFQAYTNVTDILLPECTYVGLAAFSECSSLTHIELPKCSYISTSAFYHCNSLASISLPECTYISDRAFNWLNQLASVYLPGSAFCSIYDSNVFSQYSLQSTLVKFYVNSTLVDTYKNDSKWSWYSSRIFPISE